MTGLANLDKDIWRVLETIFAGFQGAIIIDASGQIMLFSEYYAKEMDVKREEIIGKNVLEVFPTSRLMEVVQTGRPLIADRWELLGKGHIVTRIPIEYEGKIIGAIGVSVFPYPKMQYYINKLSSLSAELSYYKETVKKLSGAKYSMQSIIGQSEAIIEAKEKAHKIADSTAPVILYGETGTGKELFAHAIHQESPRRNGPLIRVNCAGIPENLMESEFFGYEEGAFTGAKKGGKPGKFELASQGSIFLDEISQLPYAMQSKLLRVLQEKEYERVGGTEVLKANARVISASNVDLIKLLQQHLFREDLFYRLNVFVIKIPPLRERIGDIPLLAEYFVKQQNIQNGTQVEGISHEAMRLLNNYHWPGNVRELEASIERACLDCQYGMIHIDNLVRFGGGKISDKSTSSLPTLKETREAAEKAAIINAIEMAAGNKQKAADYLGIHRTSLYYKLREYGLIPTGLK
ncbi:MAG TPA: sigma 54-interacting transcriptional regulator [Syntrophomonas sp.]|nr:sigma 54-interacting transcriptional regulator [Syntrophomonas sp.]